MKAEIGAKVKEIPAVEGDIHPNAHMYDANCMAAPTTPRNNTIHQLTSEKFGRGIGSPTSCNATINERTPIAIIIEVK